MINPLLIQIRAPTGQWALSPPAHSSHSRSPSLSLVMRHSACHKSEIAISRQCLVSYGGFMFSVSPPSCSCINLAAFYGLILVIT